MNEHTVVWEFSETALPNNKSSFNLLLRELFYFLAHPGFILDVADTTSSMASFISLITVFR